MQVSWRGSVVIDSLGMDEMYEIAQQAKYIFLGSIKCAKFVMDEMYEIGQYLA